MFVNKTLVQHAWVILPTLSIAVVENKLITQVEAERAEVIYISFQLNVLCLLRTGFHHSHNYALIIRIANA